MPFDTFSLSNNQGVSAIAPPEVSLGTPAEDLSVRPAARLICHSPALLPHLARPWMRAYLADSLGVPLGAGDELKAGNGTATAAVPDWAFARHTMILGASGGGKSSAMKYILAQHIARGCSLLALDPKAEMIAALLAGAHSHGIPPEKVTLLSPRSPYVPRFNPLNFNSLQEGVPLAQAVNDLVDTLAASSPSSWGPRLQNLLVNTLWVLGMHRLSLYELPRFLRRADYREHLLQMPLPAGRSQGMSRVQGIDRAAYREARAYFEDEYNRWSKSAQGDAASPVTNKISELLRNAFLRPLLCADQTTLDGGATLDFSRLWQTQSIVLAHLDKGALGEDGGRLLSGLLVQGLHHAALRAEGSVPVVLALDELPELERTVGSVLVKIATMARGQGLRLVVATQHLAALSAELRAALLSNTAVKLVFRVESEDARAVAASFAAETHPSLERATLELAETGPRGGKRATWEHPVLNAYGQPLRLDRATWERLRLNDVLRLDAKTPHSVAELVALAARSGIGRVYVHAADSHLPVELGRYVRGLAPDEYWLDGPAPLTLVVSFPRPKISGTEKWTASAAALAWTRRLQTLPIQHAVLRVAGQEALPLRIVDVPPVPRSPAYAEYLDQVQHLSGQSEREQEAVLQARDARIERVSRGENPNDGENSNVEDRLHPVGGNAARHAAGSTAVQGATEDPKREEAPELEEARERNTETLMGRGRKEGEIADDDSLW